MSINLLDLAKGYLTDAAVGKVSEFLGENPSTVQNGLTAALPTILGSIMNSGSSSDGLSKLMGAFTKGDNSGDILSNFSGLLSDKSGLEGMISGGSGILGNLLGGNLGAITSAISAFSGMKSSSTSSLLGMAAPLLMGLIGKQVKSEGLGVSGLANLLMGQKDHVKAAMPAGLTGVSSLLNFGNLGDYKGNNIKKEVEEVVETAGGFNWWPWLVGALLLLGGFWAFRNCSGDVKDAASDIQDATVAVVDSSASVATSAVDKVGTGLEALGAFFSRKLPNGIELNIPELGIENKLITFIDDKGQAIDKEKWFNFDRINFETGSATLSQDSKEQIKNISEIMKAYPAVNIKIGGYTDNTGNAASNVKLSQNRADAVMAALVGEGVEKARLASEGYGDQHPVASNDTEEGKAQNRRIAVRVTKK